MEEQRPDIRVGDRERHEVDARLRTAHGEGRLSLVEYDERARACFAARYRPELDALLTDLPDDATSPASPPRSPPVSPPAAAAPARPADPPAEPCPSLAERSKGWAGTLVGLAVAGALAFAVLGADQGAAVLGERTVVVPPGQTEVEVGVLFGSTTVVVPEGVRADTSGLTVFGSTECAAACAVQGGETLPRVEVSARGAFGSVEVRTPAEAASDVDLDE